MKDRGPVRWAVVASVLPAALLAAACGGDVTGSDEYLELVAERDGLSVERDGLASEVAELEDALRAADGELTEARLALADAEQRSEAGIPAADGFPFHAVPDGTVGVTGTATCSFSDQGTDPEGGGSGFLAVCSLDLSDPRVSGTERHDRFRFLSGGGDDDAAVVWVAEEAVLTNAEGTWRGIAQAADDSVPYGEAHYIGEGAYEGLQFHYYFGGYPIELRGWISGDE